MIKRKLDLEDAWLQQVLAVLRQHVPDRPVYAFGSRTFGRASRRSDLDLAVGGPTSVGFDRVSGMKESFSESDLPIFVDVLDVHAVSPGFLGRIQPDFILVQTGVRQP